MADMQNVEYIAEPPPDDELFKQFANVFDKFAFKKDVVPVKQEEKPSTVTSLVPVDPETPSNDQTQTVQTKTKQEANNAISKRAHKEMTRMSVAELKQKTLRPELVELHDITAGDPLFLLDLKSVKNSVPVPRHWSSKRKYLQMKRGLEKLPFQLPDFIRQTGIMEMRDSTNEKDSAKSLKARTRERVQPKMGKIQMDYQQLHDAFFKWQTKPKLSIHGDLYYEGKEFEKKFKSKPGELSNELREALGMPSGPNAHRYPPPWFAAMKRHGPPPAYPYLRIPGLNCPFPEDEEEAAGASTSTANNADN